MNIKCARCQENIIEETKSNDWLALLYFIEFLYSEETISENTYMNMAERVMSFKTYAMDCDKETLQ